MTNQREWDRRKYWKCQDDVDDEMDEYDDEYGCDDGEEHRPLLLLLQPQPRKMTMTKLVRST